MKKIVLLVGAFAASAALVAILIGVALPQRSGAVAREAPDLATAANWLPSYGIQASGKSATSTGTLTKTRPPTDVFKPIGDLGQAFGIQLVGLGDGVDGAGVTCVNGLVLLPCAPQDGARVSPWLK